MSDSYAPTAPPGSGSGKGSGKKLLWIVLLVVIAALSPFAAIRFKS